MIPKCNARYTNIVKHKCYCSSKTSMATETETLSCKLLRSKTALINLWLVHKYNIHVIRHDVILLMRNQNIKIIYVK